MADSITIGYLFDEIPVILPYELLHVDEQTVLLQYWVPFVPPPYRAMLPSENLPQFPRDGWMVCELTTSHDRLSQFRDELEATGFTFEIVSVTQSTEPTDLLTDRQQRFMTEALDAWYYDSPCECSLTDLTDELDVSKSTMSVVLRHQKLHFWLAAKMLAFWRHNAEETIIKEFCSFPNREHEHHVTSRL